MQRSWRHLTLKNPGIGRQLLAELEKKLKEKKVNVVQLISIDYKYQGKGYSRKALLLGIDYVEVLDQ